MKHMKLIIRYLSRNDCNETQHCGTHHKLGGSCVALAQQAFLMQLKGNVRSARAYTGESAES